MAARVRASQIPVGAYLLTQSKAGWALTDRKDLATTVVGDVDKVKIQKWRGHRLVVAFISSYGYQSQDVTTLTMIALQPTRITPLLDTSLSTTAVLKWTGGALRLVEGKLPEFAV